jgi:Glycosyltransferase family 25 (LPS biosynthesis protein)
MILVSDFMNITVQRVSGVRGDTVDPVVIPKETKLGNGIIGCWRSHVNCWRKTIEDGVETALVLEDDADWDVSLKDQLNLLSRELTKHGNPLQGNPSPESANMRPDAPYGSSPAMRPKTYTSTTLPICIILGRFEARTSTLTAVGFHRIGLGFTAHWALLAWQSRKSTIWDNIQRPIRCSQRPVRGGYPE